jgi:5-methyltetrahydropteroyltriglutamate--homocysteine methyltransferase
MQRGPERFMKTCTIGAYPKIPAGSGPSVRLAIGQFERGQIGPRNLYETYQAVTTATLDLAYEASLDAATDGQIRWYDFFDPLCRDIDNLNPGGLLRWFDNNFYYRHPVVTGRLQFQGGTLAAWAREAVNQSRVPIIVALPGPFTLRAMCENQSYENPAALLGDLVEVLTLEALSLLDCGIYEVQWDEPALATGLASPSPGEVQSVYGDLVKGAPLRQSAALYWGPASPWFTAFTGVARLSVDAVAEPTIVTWLSEREGPFEVGLGLIDARDVRLEDPAKLVEAMLTVGQRWGSDRVWLHPNAGLELLPPDRAAQKVALLKIARQLAQGEEV